MMAMSAALMVGQVAVWEMVMCLSVRDLALEGGQGDEAQLGGV